MTNAMCFIVVMIKSTSDPRTSTQSPWIAFRLKYILLMGGENMLTSFTIDYKHTSDPVGIVIGTHKNVTYNTLVPLYIPKLMSGIEKEKKRVTHIERIESNEIFINATDCKPKTKRKIITRSWLWGKLEHREYEKLKNGTKVTCDLNNDSPHEIYFSIK